MQAISNFIGSILFFSMYLIPIAAMITHVVFCIKAAAATGSAIALLIVGFFFFPVGIIHGICVWFGFTWI